jgi:uncharacterized protein
MTDEVMARAVALAFTKGPVSVSFFGGEPLLSFPLMARTVAHVRALAKKSQTNSPRFSLTTNGTLLTPEVTAFLRDNDFLVVVSIDGCRLAHEANRPLASGLSSYDTVQRNIEVALDALPSLETVSVIDPSNVGYLFDSLTALVSMGIFHLHFTFNYHAHWTDADLDVLESELSRMADLYVRQYRRGHPLRVRLFDDKIITQVEGGIPVSSRCPFGDEAIAVSPRGTLYPCERLVSAREPQQLAVGDVVKGPDVEKIKALRGMMLKPDGTCESCKLSHRCMHWCGCVNLATTGKIGQPSGLVCRLEQLVIQAADRAAKTLFEEKNSLFLTRFYG